MIDICLLGGVYPHEIEKELYSNSKWGIMYAANNHQWRLIEGFEENSFPLSIVSAPYLSTYMRGYKKAHVPECLFGPSNRYHSVGFRNIFLLGNKCSSLVKGLEKWYKESKQTKKCILIYCLDSTSIRAALEIKRKYKDVILCQMIPDLPEDMACNALYRLLGFKKRAMDFIYSSMNEMDMFIYLSKNMDKPINKMHKPFLISEGLYKTTEQDGIDDNKERLAKTILYTGNLNEKYGIKHLVKAFDYLDSSYKLLVRGDGDMVNFVKEVSSVDERIQYLERMEYTKLQRLQRISNILINPVLPSQSFTQNFFPSKTMEYLASGTPVIMYKLGGVPDEYYNHIFVPNDTTPESLANKITEVCDMGTKEMEAHVGAARDFILSNKNSKVMVANIVRFIQDNI